MLADVNRIFSMLCDSRPIVSLTCLMDGTYLLSGLPSIVAIIRFAILQDMPKRSRSIQCCGRRRDCQTARLDDLLVAQASTPSCQEGKT